MAFRRERGNHADHDSEPIIDRAAHRPAGPSPEVAGSASAEPGRVRRVRPAARRPYDGGSRPRRIEALEGARGFLIGRGGYSRAVIFEPFFTALNEADIRYVVVGGVAVVLQGYVRFTQDLDLIIDLEESEARKALTALTRLGLRPRVPVDAMDFADPAIRERWIREKNMTVFTLLDPDDPMRQVDIFVQHPINFEALWNRADVVPLGMTSVRVATIQDMIELKRQAGRPQDLEDIQALEAIRHAKGQQDG
jgi:hypothetical protein